MDGNEELKKGVAVTRALTHAPPETYNGLKAPSGTAYFLKRNQSINLVAEKAGNNEKLSFSEFRDKVLAEGAAASIQWYRNYTSFFKQIEFDKDLATTLGLVLSTAASGFKPKVAVSLSAAGSLLAWKANKLTDASTDKAISDALLMMSKEMWNDPQAKKVLNSEVKSALREVFGIDFEASLEEHRKYLGAELKEYVDLAVKNVQLSQEEMARKITGQLNESLKKSVTDIIKHIDEQKARETEERKKQLYHDNEIQGGIYLAMFLADKFIGVEAAKFVNTLSQSALQVSNIMSAVANGSMGPIGAIAGFMNVSNGLMSLFGSPAPQPHQIILEAIGQVQVSIQALHKDMITWFGVIAENQQKMLERIDRQFELLREQNGRNYAEVMESLNTITDKIDFLIIESRQGRRSDDYAELNEHYTALETEVISKNNSSSVYDKDRVKEAIEKFWSFGTNIAKYDSFTALPRDSTSLRWNAQEIKVKLDTPDSVDHFVGIVPLLIERFTKNKTAAPCNPSALSRAAAMISYAYAEFPELARSLFESHGRNFLKDMTNVLSDTKTTLLEAVSEKTITNAKEIYFSLIDNILDIAFTKAYKDVIAEYHELLHKHHFDNPKVDAAGPLNQLSLEGEKTIRVKLGDTEIIMNSPLYYPWPTSLCASDMCSQQSDLDELFPREKRYFITYKLNALKPDDYRPVPNPREKDKLIDRGFSKFFVRFDKFKGVDQKDVSRLCEINELFDLAEKFHLIKMEKGPMQKRELTLKDEVKSIIPFQPPSKLKVATVLEEYTPAKIFLFQGDNTPITIGDGVSNGWMVSTLKSIKIYCKDGKEIELQDLDIQYLSENLITSGKKPFPIDEHDDGGMSLMQLLLERLNLMYNVRSSILSKAKDNIKNDNTLSEFEAVGHCLRYLAGLNTYIKTGDRDLGTAIVKGEVSVGDKVNIPRSFDELINFIFAITSQAYLYEPDYITYRTNGGSEIKEYVRSEIQKVLDQYIAVFFPSRLDELSIRELQLGELMLLAAENEITGNE